MKPYDLKGDYNKLMIHIINPTVLTEMKKEKVGIVIS
jgi:hypothetical protein